nr:retrovirus-related Pol polyprotein from transposon TNT 1-94 [Tanacetum cinerariifolium]
PDIVYATCLCAGYQAKPTEKHLKEDFYMLIMRMSRHLQECFRRNSFLRRKVGELVLEKQDCTSLSTSEAECVSLSACCAQVLWIRAQLTGYGFYFNKIPIYYDSKSAIAISCNPIQHSKTKHITIRYHFIKKHVEKGMIELYFVKTEYQLAVLFTKALLVDRFNYLVRHLEWYSLVFTPTMEILIVSTSNRTAVDVPVMRTRKYGESNAYALEDPTILAGNPVKEILHKLNLPYHRYNISYYEMVLTEPEKAFKDEHEGEDTRSQDGIRFKDKDIRIQDKIKAKDNDIKLRSQDIKSKIKIQDHKHVKGSSKGFPRTQGFKTQDVTRSEATIAMTTH